MKRLEAFIGEWVVKNRWWIIVVTLVLAASGASGGRFLTFVNDSRVFFSKDNPQLQALETLENTFTKNENILFVIAPQSGEVFSRETLMVVDEVTQAAWQIPYSSRVDSITNFQHTWAEDDDMIVEDLILDAAALSDADLVGKRKIALAEPLLVNRLISSSARVTGVSVNILKPGKSMMEVREAATYVKEMVAGLSTKYPDIKIYLTGGVIIDNAFGEASEQDMKTLMPLMYCTLLVIMGLTLRSVSGTIATFIVIAISMFTGLGLAGWIGINLTPASANAPTIILTLAVADSIHILVTLFQQMRQGMDKFKAISESIRVNMQPVFLTSLTTAIGFLTMNFSDAPPFRDLGNIVAMGVAAAFVYSVFFLPALMAVLPIRIRPSDTQNNLSTTGNGLNVVKKGASLNGLADFVIKYKKQLFWGVGAVVILLSMGITRIELNDDFVKYFDQRYDFRRASDFTEANLTGFDVIEYSLAAGETDGINDPAYLEKVEEFANWYRKQPGVVHVNTITDIMKRLNKNMHGDDQKFYKIPSDRALAAQYLLLYELSLPFGLDLNNQINVDKSATRLTVTLSNMTSKDIRSMEEKGRAWLKNNAPPSMFTYGSGLSVMFAHISERNIKSMLSASVLALVLISLLLIFALRDVRLGIVSLVPNLAPAFMAFGIWGIFVGEVGLAVSVMIALTLGIVVDDTIHFMSKYQRARREHHMDPADAVRYSFNTVGSAMWVTTLILVAGFIVLSFSGFKINSDMGMMTAITIILALALDFIFLPVLLLKLEEEKDEIIENDFVATRVIDPVPAIDKCGDS